MLAEIQPDEYASDVALNAARLYESVAGDPAATSEDMATALDGLGDMVAVADVYESTAPAWSYYATAIAVVSSDVDRKLSLVLATIDWLGRNDVACRIICSSLINSIDASKLTSPQAEQLTHVRGKLL